jgi:hypothetical protein
MIINAESKLSQGLLLALLTAAFIGMVTAVIKTYTNETVLVNHEIRLSKIHTQQAEQLKTSNDINRKQDKVLFQLCLLLNEGDIQTCFASNPEGAYDEVQKYLPKSKRGVDTSDDSLPPKIRLARYL